MRTGSGPNDFLVCLCTAEYLIEGYVVQAYSPEMLSFSDFSLFYMVKVMEDFKK